MTNLVSPPPPNHHTNSERKIDLQSACVECDSRFCRECLFQMRKTKMCKSCKATDSIKETRNRNDFVDDLVALIQLFDQDTDQHIVKENFLAVETAENLERIFNKEKSNVFNHQQFYATSTPSHNNAKKVNFQTDITMIPPSVKEANKQMVVESTEKVNPKNKKSTTNEKSTASSTASLSAGKRKADSMGEKVENSSKTKKAKLTTAEQPEEEEEEDEVEIAKENLNEQNEMDVDKQQPLTALVPAPVDKQPMTAAGPVRTVLVVAPADKSVEKQQPVIVAAPSPDKSVEKQQTSRLNSQLQVKDLDNRLLEENNKLHSEYKRLLEERLLDFKQFEQKLLDDRKQFEERLLAEKKQFEETLLSEQKQFEERLVQVLKGQTLEIGKLHSDSMQTGMVGLFKLFAESKSSVASSIQLDKIGKVKFTIEPFVEPPKKVMRSVDTQTETFKKPTGEIYVQTEPPALVDQSVNTETKQFADADVQYDQTETMDEQQPTNEFKTPVSNPTAFITQSQDDVRQVVNNVINKSINACNGKQQNGKVSNGDVSERESSFVGPNKSNNLTIQFDETYGAKELNYKAANKDAEDPIDSDELKKPVDNSTIFDDEMFDDDDIIPSSPMC